ncbi:MAG: prephenate dehydrogenase [Coxiella sp. (in: Bacteria)]|nr:MAG: prephenate dehydrogenase [Coxiella sp. (in: g-proteobacteria)]
MTVAIIGKGRFGTLLQNILQPDHSVTLYDIGDALTTLNQHDTVFLCVPIREFDAVVADIAPHLTAGTTVIDTCSVKLYPVDCMQKHLPDTVNIIATHPLFGPDSYFEGTQNKMVMIDIQGDTTAYTTWKTYFSSLGIDVIELSADEHDQFAARSQGITHLLGRALNDMGICPTPIDTLGFTRLLGIVDQTCNDSRVLFEDLQQYNPYTEAVLDDLKKSLL